jgi:hypothetical protein
MFRENYGSLRRRAKDLFAANPTVRSPYFDAAVVLNADWLHHLRYYDRRERSKPEQMLKFRFTTVRLRVPLRVDPRFLSCESRSFFLRSSTCKDSRIERRWGTVPAGDRVYLSGTHIGMGRGPTVASRNAASTPLMGRGGRLLVTPTSSLRTPPPLRITLFRREPSLSENLAGHQQRRFSSVAWCARASLA